jgi:hypothetical protein
MHPFFAWQHCGATAWCDVYARGAGRWRSFARCVDKNAPPRASPRRWLRPCPLSLKRKGRSLRFAGKAFRVFERERLEDVQWRSGCFAQDAVGDWWLCLAVEQAVAPCAPIKEAVGNRFLFCSCRRRRLPPTPGAVQELPASHGREAPVWLGRRIVG